MTREPRDPATAAHKQALRQSLRAARRAVRGRAAAQAAAALTWRVQHLPIWRRARVVGLFLSGDGEIETTALIHAAHQAGKHVALPVIRPPRGQRGRRAVLQQGALVFRDYQPGDALRPGWLGIPEPIRTNRRVIPLNTLDLLLMPLVGFDDQGHRLGMGGGFYDRTLAERTRFRRPRLVGIAHACQQVSALPSEPWDQPLEACVTDQRTLTW
ncbi:5-formyltetrahydrofolate cyclo-ligase [Spiribacter salinus]|uniref:5-formyltetrahydrofolate cyclo-ligase n=1 Tax=Spiribacter salinus TaxID=1335746 RepID=UPI001C9383CD|nr:5-formyltetrahydrofolate cyclo-ligase [Spiribacter salinus]MBY5268721.1 5-formyltetrahydrofolate cyclo-ligase [Spiribacter salinus]